jgi:hypothetical protein
MQRRIGQQQCPFPRSLQPPWWFEVWLDEAMREQANEWCDDNPDLCDKSNSHWEGIEGHGNHPAEGDASLANTRAEAKIEANARKREAAGYDPDGIVLRGGSRR